MGRVVLVEVKRESGEGKADKEATRSFLEHVRLSIIDDQLTKKIYSSGKSARSLTVGLNGKVGQLLGEDYFQQQIIGRRPGKFPPVDQIKDWLKEKGIKPSDISQDSLAFLIARKIARRGTDIYLGKRRGIDMLRIIKDSDDELVAGLKKSILDKINSKLKVFNPKAV